MQAPARYARRQWIILYGEHIVQKLTFARGGLDVVEVSSGHEFAVGVSGRMQCGHPSRARWLCTFAMDSISAAVTRRWRSNKGGRGGGVKRERGERVVVSARARPGQTVWMNQLVAVAPWSASAALVLGIGPVKRGKTLCAL